MSVDPKAIKCICRSCCENPPPCPNNSTQEDWLCDDCREGKNDPNTGCCHTITDLSGFDIEEGLDRLIIRIRDRHYEIHIPGDKTGGV